MSIIEELKSSRQQADAEYASLVEQVAGGQTVQPREAKAVLASVNKTPDDLERDVQRCRRIAELQAVVATRPDLEARRRELQAARVVEMAQEEAELREVQQRHSTTRSRYDSALALIRVEERRIKTAQEELHSLTQLPQSEPAARTLMPIFGSLGVGAASGGFGDWEGRPGDSRQPKSF